MLTVSRLTQRQRVPITKDQTATLAEKTENILSIHQQLDQQQSFEIIQTLLLVSASTYWRVSAHDSLLVEIFFLINPLKTETLTRFVKTFVVLLATLGKAALHQPKKVRLMHFAAMVPRDSVYSRSFVEGIPRLAKSYTAGWKQEGIFDALSQRYLSSAQLSIIVDQSQPSNVIEAYNFTFRYDTESHHSEDATKKSNAVQSSEKSSTSSAKVKENLFTVIRHLVSLCQTMPNLPETRFLTIHLFYTENCPPEYCPPGFQPNHELDMLVPDTEDWKLQRADVGTMDSGFYSVHLGADYLSQLRGEASDADEIAVPADISYSKRLHRKEFPSHSREKQSEERESSNIIKIPSETPSTISLHSIRSESQANTEKRELNSSTAPANIDKTKELYVKERLQNMLRSPSVSNDLTQTQPVLEETFMQEDKYPWAIVPSKDHELWEKRDTYIKDVSLPEQLWKCKCECGFNEKEGVMVQCDCCDTWQHRHCYALDGQDLASIHVCYVCLLEDSEKPLLREMRSLSRMRRICWTIRNRAISASEQALAELLGYSKRELSPLLRDLKKEKIVVNAPQDGRTQLKIMVDEKEAATNFERYGCLHPLASIQHHYTRRAPTVSSRPQMAERSPPPLVAQCETEVQSTSGWTEELLAVGPDVASSALNGKVFAVSEVRRSSIAEHPIAYPGSSASTTNSRKRKRIQESQRMKKHLCSSKAKSPLDASDPI